MPEQYSAKRLVRPLEIWFAHVAKFARERKRWWASDHDKKLTRDMPPPRPRGPSDPNAVGSLASGKQNKKDGKKNGKKNGKKDGKKDSNTELPKDATNSKEDTGEAKGPSTHSKS